MKDDRLKWIHRAMNIVALISVLASLFFGSFVLTLSVFLGYLFIKINFWLLCLIVSSISDAGSNELKKGRLIAVLIAKYVGLVAGGAALLYFFDLHFIGLLIGMTTLTIAIGMLAMRKIFISKV
jgi:hypothetical protein